MWFRSLAGMMLLSALLLSPASRADTDQDQARDAVRAGEILPLEQMMKTVRQAYPGEVLEVELERKSKLWVYDIKLLQSNGLVRKVRLNAKTAALLESKTKPASKEKQRGPQAAPGEGS